MNSLITSPAKPLNEYTIRNKECVHATNRHYMRFTADMSLKGDPTTGATSPAANKNTGRGRPTDLRELLTQGRDIYIYIYIVYIYIYIYIYILVYSILYIDYYIYIYIYIIYIQIYIYIIYTIYIYTIYIYTYIDNM